MTLESFENIFSLFCTIIGLLACLFKYIETPKKTCLYLVFYFLARFLSDYYWTVYQLVMDTYPNVSSFVANLGWNIGYFVLLIALLCRVKEHGRKYLNPITLWPLLTNIPLLVLYMQFGGIINNIYEVGITTFIMIICSGELFYFIRNRKNGAHFPFLPVFILSYEILTYGMWTASCFDWKATYANPYFYCEIIASIITVFYAWGMKRDYEIETSIKYTPNASNIRFNATLQTLSSFIIFTLCIGGYFTASWINESIQAVNIGDKYSNVIIFTLFFISVIIALLVLLMLYKLTVFHQNTKKKDNEKDKNEENHNRVNLLFTITFTFILMTLAVVYNTRKYYSVAVTGVFEDGENKVKMTSAHLENYLTDAEATLRVTADTIDYMNQNGNSSEDIQQFLHEQTQKEYSRFEKNFTGIYAYVNGIYLDGTAKIPLDKRGIF